MGIALIDNTSKVAYNGMWSCTKCPNGGVQFQYIPADQTTTNTECLQVKCQTCGYTEYMACKT